MTRSRNESSAGGHTGVHTAHLKEVAGLVCALLCCGVPCDLCSLLCSWMGLFRATPTVSLSHAFV